ncbi:spore coat protein SP85-like [Dendronephthya gigantea]|uniref:spore coat protein SP85-like n=1 Tax=Dendronephthya gigantea TaxID=151771 RepID=UPI00106AE172|nr:spore coat protein SP85-like [Dendronephthya gigantea]
MASEAGPPPAYNPDLPPNNPPYPIQQPYYPPSAPPSYTSHDQTKAYPMQTAAPYPQQGVPPGYPPQGAAPGYTTQGVGVTGYHQHNQTTIITQQPTSGVIIHTTQPPDFMVVSIISMFCCFFIGIFAVLKSMRSRDLFRQGDYAGAQEVGMQAKKLAYVSIFVAVCLYVFIVILRIALSVALNN